MTDAQRMQNLQVPAHPVDVVLDTDAYNEIDDQFAIAYLFRSKKKLRVQAIYAAPFYNANSASPQDGMQKSYDEIFKLLSLLGEDCPVFKGSESYLKSETVFCPSSAATDLVRRAKSYSAAAPLYVVAIGAITNIASALLQDPSIAERIVVVWLGGHAHHYHDTKEFNMYQDIAAARVVMQSGAPFVQLPCLGVVDLFTISAPELIFWLKGKNALADYLADNTIAAAERYAKGMPWTRVIWDVTAVAWLLNDADRFMASRVIQTRLPAYDGTYASEEIACSMRYVYHINRDVLMQDLIQKLQA